VTTTRIWTRKTVTITAPPVAISNHPDHYNYILYVNYDNITSISKTTATLQVVANPILNKKYSPIATKLYYNLRLLNADLVRYAAWYPYPKIGVAELEPPNYKNKTTSWKFGNELQQIFLDTWNSVVVKQKNNSKRLVITFSTQPAWVFNTTDWSYLNETNKADWKYAGKGVFTETTTKLVADYYGRFASWIINGEFHDEFGSLIGGGPKLGLGRGGVTHWEIFNEPEAEHTLSIEQYNKMYDAIVRNIRERVDPNHTIKFFGLSLLGHNEWDWWNGYLNLSNHEEDVHDAITNGYASFHFYALLSSRTNITTFTEVWSQLNVFLKEVDTIIKIRDELSPSTKLAINEAGVIPPDDNDNSVEESPPIYYNMVAAFYTVLWSHLSTKGIDIVGSSQYCGCPSILKWNISDRQYPGVTMTNWTTGNGNPRYWALKLILESTNHNNDQIVYSNVIESSTTSNSELEEVYIQGRITKKGDRIMIIVNKSYLQQTVLLPSVPSSRIRRENNNKNIVTISSNDDKGTYYYHVSMVDETTHDGPWKEFNLTTSTDGRLLMLNPFAVAVVRVIDSDINGKDRRSFGLLPKLIK